VNRGVAHDRGRIFVGTLDGRLVAIDAETGDPLWETLTVDPGKPYSITGAPRVVAGKVIIGNGGADLGVRGYVSAYAVDTGELVWRTYTVPGNPADGFESEALERAADTWTGEWWRGGGGGTVWDAIAHDPELNLIYVGTGNGAPYPRWLRSPDGGDNLFLASILALNPDTGEIVWHYQTTPAETWDYTATQHILLADLEIDGVPRKVLVQAPKNGFFYVIDRTTGEFISATPFVEVTWASGFDASGRPIETDVDYRREAKFVKPSPLGAHNWQPMSFNPETGLVYLPAKDMGSVFKMDPDWTYDPRSWNTGLDVSAFEEFGSEAEGEIRGFLLAWDPVERREVWSVEHVTGSNGGTLSSAGNLVFQGTADGRFVAYRATDGEKLWESPAGTGVMAGPITYTLDDTQYVAVAAGWGAAFAMGAADAALRAGVRGGGRVLAFALDATGEVPPAVRPPLGPVPTPTFELTASDAQRKRGSNLYHLHCAACHGPLAIGGGSGVPDLRHSSAEIHARFGDVVIGGIKVHGGMPSFADLLNAEDLHAIQAFILERARLSAAADAAP
jgi:PQQ-dependent dehydrogenase (methanol/ethanol family)